MLPMGNDFMLGKCECARMMFRHDRGMVRKVAGRRARGDDVMEVVGRGGRRRAAERSYTVSMPVWGSGGWHGGYYFFLKST